MSRKPVFTFILIFCFFSIHALACIHHTLDVRMLYSDPVALEEELASAIPNPEGVQPEPLQISEVEEDGAGPRRILSVAGSGIRILADYTYFSADSGEIDDHIRNNLMPAAINYFSWAVSVRFPLSTNIYVQNSISHIPCAYNFPVPGYLRPGGSGANADLVVLVTAENSRTSYLAYALPCIGDQYGRPVIGQLMFNTRYMSLDDDDIASQVATTLHEVTHILGFSDSLYGTYINPTTRSLLGYGNVVATVNRGGVFIKSIITSNVVDKAKAYFGCNTLTGLDLENEGQTGSAGSHWERKILYNEMMTASDLVDIRFSEFTLALLQDSGWYTVNYSMADSMTWGKNRGCTFINSACIQSNTAAFVEFCSPLQSQGCAWGNDYKSVCAVSTSSGSPSNSAYNYFGNNTVSYDSFANNCPYQLAYTYLGTCRNPLQTVNQNYYPEAYGSNSKCFQVTLTDNTRYSGALTNVDQGCFAHSCSSNNGAYTLTVTVGSQTVTCSSASNVAVAGYNGVLVCPDPTEFCSKHSPRSCRNQCLMRGRCVNNLCVCEEGWGGEDCELRVYVSGCSRCSGDRNTCYGDQCIFGRLLEVGVIGLIAMILVLFI